MRQRLKSLTSALEIACSGGVFFGCANVLPAKVPCGKRGENGMSQKERGRGERRESVVFSLPPPPFSSFALAPTLKVTIFTLPNLILRHNIKDGGFNSMNIDKQLSKPSNTNLSLCALALLLMMSFSWSSIYMYNQSFSPLA